MINFDQEEEYQGGEGQYDEMCERQAMGLVECPHCGSQTITCRHCKWTWSPRSLADIPKTCPRCRNDWTEPFKWSVKSKYGHGTVDPRLYAEARKAMDEYMKKRPHRKAEISV